MANGSMFGGALDNPWAAAAMTLGPALMAYGFQQPGLAQIGPQMLMMNQQAKERAARAEREKRELALEEAEAAREAALSARVSGMFGPSAPMSLAGPTQAYPGAAPGTAGPGTAGGMVGPDGAMPPTNMFSGLTPEQRQIVQSMAQSDPMAALKYAGGLLEPIDPMSRIGKLEADLAADRISPEQYEQGAAAIGRPLVSMPAGETAEAKAVGQWQAQQYTGLQDAAQAARQQNARLDTMNELLENVYTGAGGEQVLAAKRLASLVGADPEGIGDAEAAQALANEMALTLRNPAGGAGMPGAMSDRDREFLASMTPGLGMTKEGRETLIEVRKRTNQRSIEVARLAREYRREKGRLDEGFYDMLDARYGDQSMFDDLATAPPQPTRLRFDAQGNIIQ